MEILSDVRTEDTKGEKGMMFLLEFILFWILLIIALGATFGVVIISRIMKEVFNDGEDE